MVLNDDSLQTIKTALEQDLGCDRINIKPIFATRLKLLHAMAAIEPPKLTGVIQADETNIQKSQKGHNLELVSYVKGLERVARYGRRPSKLGVMGAEFCDLFDIPNYVRPSNYSTILIPLPAKYTPHHRLRNTL